MIRLRITSGRLKNRLLENPPDASGHLSFTSGAMKEALFSILGGCEGQGFVDLFAGSGQVGWEACSRGFEPVYFIEKDRRRFQFIRTTVERFTKNEPLDVTALGCDFERFLKSPPVDLNEMVIFIDPPWGISRRGRLLHRLIFDDYLKARNLGGLFVFQLPAKEGPAALADWQQALPAAEISLRNYGSAALVIVDRRGRHQPDSAEAGADT